MTRPFLMLAFTLPVTLGLPQPASAKSPVNEWFCKVLKTPFDPKSAIASFPLEKLPVPVETREEKADSDGDKTTWVELQSEGENYEVSYKYAFNNKDVTDPYGFGLRVYASGPDSDAVEAEMDKWLAEFGPPERSMMGRAVFAGPKSSYMDEPFKFERWSGASYSADWFKRGDLRYAAELCSKH